MRRRSLFALLVLAATHALPASAEEAGNPYLDEARRHYERLEFDRCLQRLELAPQWPNTRRELVELELLSGLCHFNLGHTREASEHFSLALKIDRDAQLPPFTSPKIVSAFEAARRELPPAVSDAPRTGAIEPRPKAVEPASPSAPGASAQSPRRYTLPISLAAVSAAATGAGVYFGTRARALEHAANTAHFASEGLSLGRAASANATAANVAFGVAVTAAAGVALSFLLSGE